MHKRPCVPTRIFFTLTRECNLSCKTCYNPVRGDRSAPDMGRIKKVIDRMKEAGIAEVIVTGGEPFLYPGLFEVLDHILGRGMGVRVNTNGLLLTDKVLAGLKERKAVTVTVGLDGVSERTDDFIRGEGHYRQAVKALEKLSGAGIRLFVNFTATRSNISDLPRLRGFFRQFNVSRIIVNVFIRAGRGAEYGEILALSKFEYFLLLLFRIFGSITRNPALTVITSCYAGRTEACIDYTGSFYFCELLDHSFGNVLEKNIREMWDSQDLQRLMEPRQFGLPCGACLFRDSCTGSCRAEVFSATKDLYAGNPYCLKGKLCARKEI